MAKQAEVTYLLNSGFLVNIDGKLLIFDYYHDPEKNVRAALNDCKSAYVFASHAHFDHFNPEIGKYAAHVDHYFFSFDIRGKLENHEIPDEKVAYLNPYDGYQGKELRVTTYSSTDEGVSFLVESDGWRIFHAGDFNWWHWKGDTEENNLFAKNGFMKQMKRLDGLKADIAFFPVDSRLEEYMDIGAREFCRRTSVNYLITMHNTKGDVWKPAADFFAGGAEIPIWSPMLSGENIKIIK